MRISRKRRPEKPIIPHYNVNEHIHAPEVRVIDRAGANLGILPIANALRLAQEQEVDLVEINPKANPPVAQLIEFSHFKYQREKEAKKQKINAHVSDTKGVRLSIRIGSHDIETRRAQAAKFLERGDKVRAEIILRGREHAQTHLGFDIIKKFFALMEKTIPLRVDQEITKQGNKITGIVAKK